MPQRARHPILLLAIFLVSGGCFSEFVEGAGSSATETSGGSDTASGSSEETTGPDATDTSSGGDASTGGPGSESSGSTTGWQWRRRLTVDADTAAIRSPLAHVPVLVRLSPERFDYGAVKPDGSDVAFFGIDEETPLPYEVEVWDPAGESLLWVRVPAVGAPPNDHLWMYYGAEDEAGLHSPAEVWQPDYVGVWHLGGEASEPIVDSSANAPAGSAGDSVVEADGIAGRALEFDAGDDISVPNAEAFAQPEEFSLEAWARPSELQEPRQRAVSKSSAYGLDVSTANGFESRTAVFEGEGDWLTGATAPEAVELDAWVYLAGTYSDEVNRVHHYVDGISVTNNGGDGNVFVNESPLTIGTGVVGVLDEVRISVGPEAPTGSPSKTVPFATRC